MKFRRIKKLKLIHQCPKCGSGDVEWCNISVRPYCNDCHYWGGVNYGSKNTAIANWNNSVVNAVYQPSHIRLASFSNEGYPVRFCNSVGDYTLIVPLS